jgi:hypothetical protein
LPLIHEFESQKKHKRKYLLLQAILNIPFQFENFRLVFAELGGRLRAVFPVSDVSMRWTHAHNVSSDERDKLQRIPELTYQTAEGFCTPHA